MQVVIDVDTGVDDALALLLAARHPGMALRAVTCVAGNADLPTVVRNTLDVLDVAGAPDVPVAAGAQRPLVAEPATAAFVHGRNGIAGLDLADLGADPSREPVAQHAVELLRSAILGSPEPVTVIGLAPLTNIGLLLRTHPEVTGNIERIAFMGGSAGSGNATPLAEFNVWHDPEAAHIATTAGVPVLMYGLDVFYQPRPAAADVAAMASSEDPAARLAAELLHHLDVVYRSEPRAPTPEDGRTGGLGDAGLLCALLRPDVLRTEHLPLAISMGDGVARGRTIVDRRATQTAEPIHPRPLAAPRAEIALGIDGAAAAALFTGTLLGR